MGENRLEPLANSDIHSVIVSKTFLHPLLSVIAKRPELTKPSQSIGPRLGRDHDRDIARTRWHYNELIRHTIPESRYRTAILHDEVLWAELKEKQYSPEFIDHGVQHGSRVNNNWQIGAIWSGEFRDISIRSQGDAAMAMGPVGIFHDSLQLDITVKEKKRLAHDLVAGKWIIPGMMILGNLLGRTNYNDRQIALASALGASHEVEQPNYGTDLPGSDEIIQEYSRKFNKPLTEVFPTLKWLYKRLERFGINLFHLDLDFSDISPRYFAKVRNLFMAADLREQVAPPSWAAMRSIKAIPGRLWLDPKQDSQHYFDFIDRVAEGYEPGNSEFSDTTLRAAYETARGLPSVDQPAFMKSWMKYSQIKRGGYHTDFAHDLVAISHDLIGQTLFRKYLELCRDVEAELWNEQSIRTTELSDTFAQIGRFDLNQIYKIFSGKFQFFSDHSSLEKIGGYIFQEFASGTMALRHAGDLMHQAGGFEENSFLTKTEEIIHYAKHRNAFHAAPVDSDIFTLPMKKLVVTLSDF